MNKIDLIIDALEKAKDGWQSFDEYANALTAARELRALKPVAWGEKSSWGELEGLSFDKQPRFNTPLYALDGEQA